MTDAQRRNKIRNKLGRHHKKGWNPEERLYDKDDPVAKQFAIDTKTVNYIKSIPMSEINDMNVFELTRLAESIQRQLRKRFKTLEKAEAEQDLFSHAMASFRASFEPTDITVSRLNTETGEREEILKHIEPDFRIFARLRNRKERVFDETVQREVYAPNKSVNALRHFINKARQFFSADTATIEGIKRVNAAQDEWLFAPTGTLHHLTNAQRKQFWALIDRFAAKYERDYAGFMYLPVLNAAATFWVQNGGIIGDVDSAVDAIHRMVLEESPDPWAEENDPFSTGLIGNERRI